MRDLAAKPTLEFHQDLDRLEGIAAQRQQIVLRGGPGAADHRLEGSGYAVERGIAPAGGHVRGPHGVQRLQALAVDLEVRQPRQGLQVADRGDHVGGQAARRHRQHVPGQKTRGGGARLDVGRQGAGLAVPPAAHDHGRVGDAGAGAQRGLDFRGLDAMSTQLHQLVLAADELDEAIGPHAAHVAGGEDARPRILLRAPEAGGGQLGFAPIAQGDVRAGHHRLPDLARSDGRAFLVGQDQSVGRGGQAHRHSSPLRRHGGIGGPVGVADRDLGGGYADLDAHLRPEGGPGQLHIAPFAALAHQPHHPHVVQARPVPDLFGDAAEQGRHHVQHGEFPRPHLVHQGGGAELLGRQDVQGRAREDPRLHQGDRGHGSGEEQAEAILGSELANLDEGLGRGQGRAMAVDHALGGAGGA